MEKKSFKEVIQEPQNIIALGVTIISVCALMVSIMQTRIMSEQRELMYEQAKASVWPRLQIDRYKSHNTDNNQIIDYKLTLSNGGVGPAIITDVRVSFENKPQKNWGYFFKYFNLPDTVKTYTTTGDINNTIVKIGADIVFFDLQKNLPLAHFFYKNESKMKIEIWYKSIYGDKWKLTYQNEIEKTEEVDNNFTLPKEEQFRN